MGEAIFKDNFTPEDYTQFSERLEQQLGQMRALLQQPRFNDPRHSIGAELELYLVDDHYRPAAVNEQLLTIADHPQLTEELNQYNLEYNLSPVAAAGRPFAQLEKEMRELLDLLQSHARGIGANIIPIGILPTLQEQHVRMEYMTQRNRYRALARGLSRDGGSDVQIRISGKDELQMLGDGVTVEGANTSFQVHLRVPASEFACNFNAAQLTTPLVLALATNSPLIAGRRLWQESRIALFKQSIDNREPEMGDWRQPARVSFGHGWLRKSPWELFAENVALYPPIIPALTDIDPALDPPRLAELCLHHGTIWPWNRAVYSAADGGHMRIEFRYLPAGPTVIDMLANAALAIGWAVGLEESVDQYLARLPFRFAEYNFYRAAQHGLEARLLWPRKNIGGLEERPVAELIEEFMPRARLGLERIGVESSEIDRLWRVIEQRLETRRTGSIWQLEAFEEYRKSCTVEDACARLLADYIENVKGGNPVASWC